MLKSLVFVLGACLVAANAVPSELLNEWSQFKADDEFYEQMDAFLQTGSQDAGGDFEFKCETTCQLVQKNAVTDGGAGAGRASFLETGSVEEQVQSAFYEKVDSFLETQAKTGDAGGDFEFKCETTCQLVQKNAVAEEAAPAPQAAAHAAARAAHANNFLQTEAGLESQAQAQVEAQASVSTEQAKDCYRLCLNPSMNPGCDVASNAVALLETGAMTEAELMRKNWSLGSGSGNCLNSCVHVCMAVHDSVSK